MKVFASVRCAVPARRCPSPRLLVRSICLRRSRTTAIFRSGAIARTRSTATAPSYGPCSPKKARSSRSRAPGNTLDSTPGDRVRTQARRGSRIGGRTRAVAGRSGRRFADTRKLVGPSAGPRDFRDHPGGPRLPRCPRVPPRRWQDHLRPSPPLALAGSPCGAFCGRAARANPRSPHRFGAPPGRGSRFPGLGSGGCLGRCVEAVRRAGYPRSEWTRSGPRGRPHEDPK